MNIAQTLPLADTWGMHGGDVGWGWMMILMVLFWGAVILGIVWLIRGSARGWSAPAETPAGRESSLDILERRFAEGAISLEDYRARRQVLLNGTADSNGPHEEVPLAASRAGGG